MTTNLNPAAALLWQLEAGIDLPLADALVSPGIPAMSQAPPEPQAMAPSKPTAMERPPARVASQPQTIMPSILRDEAVRLAMAAQTLNELHAAIENFDGITIKRHATRMVFADGLPTARIMLVGEAPGADEDIQGRPFVGVAGQLLDKMLAAIQVSRHADRVAQAVAGATMALDPGPRRDDTPPTQHPIYITNILNWRPPGNRTPTPEEIDLSLPFIERHIGLIKPDVLVLAGGVAAKALLGVEDGITKLRGRWRDYTPRTIDAILGHATRAMPIYHPSFLLRTPIKKREAWEDLQLIKMMIQEMNIR
jgi:DNA polymerase